MADKAYQSKIELVGDGSKAVSELQRVERQGRTFATGLKNTFASVNRYIDAATEHFGFFGTAVTAFTTGAVLKKLFSVSDFIPIDTALLQMQANMHKSASEISGLRTQLAGLAGREGKDIQQVFAQGAKLSAFYSGADITKIMEASAKVSDVMKEDLATSTDMVVKIMKMYRQGADSAGEIADSLIASRAPLERMGIFFERGIMRGAASKDYKEVLALVGALQKSGVINPRIAGQVEGTLNSIEKKAATLKKVGIDIFTIDPATGKKLKKDLDGVLGAFEARLKKAKAEGRTDEGITAWLDKYLAPGAGEAMPFLISQRDKLRMAVTEQGNAAQIAAERAAKADIEWGKQLERIKSHLAGIETDLAFVYRLAEKPVQFFAQSPGAVKAGAYGAAGLALTVGGGLLYGKGRAFARSLAGTATGVAEGKALEAAAGIAPVFVTNWPAGGMGPGGGPVAGPAGTAALKDALKWAGLIAPPVAGGVAAGLFLEYAGRPEVRKESTDREAAARAVDEHTRSVTGKLTNEINIYIDPATGRARADSTGMETKVNFNMFKRGKL